MSLPYFTMIPSHWTEDDLDLNGARLHYYRAGLAEAGGKPPLVFVHGFTDTGLCWQPTADALAAEYAMVLPDARGHGRSARLQAGAHYDLVADLAAIIRTLRLDRPIVFGHSMGAMEATELAACHPDLVRALVLVDPTWRKEGFDTPGHFEIRPDGPLAQFVRTLPGKTLEQLIEECRAENPTWPEVIVQHWCEGKKLLDQNIVGTPMTLTGITSDSVKRIACPVLLVTGDPKLGAIVTPELAAIAQGLNPGIRVARIAGAGHHIPFSSHAPYMAAVRDFLATA